MDINNYQDITIVTDLITRNTLRETRIFWIVWFYCTIHMISFLREKLSVLLLIQAEAFALKLCNLFRDRCKVAWSLCTLTFPGTMLGVQWGLTYVMTDLSPVEGNEQPTQEPGKEKTHRRKWPRKFKSGKCRYSWQQYCSPASSIFGILPPAVLSLFLCTMHDDNR